MKVLCIIPARYASTRFPGKPLAVICGKPMIQRVFEQVIKASSVAYATVATDDLRIVNAVRGFGGNVVMTRTNHSNGTSRCFEAMEIVQKQNPALHFDVVVNIQGDEPYIQPEQIDVVANLFSNQETQIGTLIKKIDTYDDLFSPHVVKVAFDADQKALFFSRNPIPFVRNFQKNEWLKSFSFYKHIGIYAYRKKVLQQIVALKSGKLEKAENLEQLRWLENGFSIQLKITKLESIGIDTPEDLSKLTNNPC